MCAQQRVAQVRAVEEEGDEQLGVVVAAGAEAAARPGGGRGTLLHPREQLFVQRHCGKGEGGKKGGGGGKKKNKGGIRNKHKHTNKQTGEYSASSGRKQPAGGLRGASALSV